MSKARVGRTIYVTHCVGIGFDQNNNPFNVDINLYGKVKSIDQANNRARRKLHNSKILINEYETTSAYYSMNIEDFMEHATLVTNHQ